MSLSSSLMDLIIPQSGDPAPSYINAIAQSLELIDAHNHTTGKGAQIPSAGININDTLQFNGNSAKGLFSVQMLNRTGPPTGSPDEQSLYALGGDLWYFNETNQAVRITNGSALADVSAGYGFYGDYAAYSAEAKYVHSTKQYSFYDETFSLAPINCSSIYAAGGYKYPVGPIYQPATNFPANTTNHGVPFTGQTTYQWQVELPWAGSIIGIHANSIAGSITAGTIAFSAAVNGSAVGSAATLSNTALSAAQTFTRTSIPFAAYIPISVLYTTSASFASSSDAIYVNVWVQEN